MKKCYIERSAESAGAGLQALGRGLRTILHADPELVSLSSMEEIEKHFRCPYCLERISMILDLSVEGEQRYVEDCEVCCNPIQVSYSVSGDGKLSGFRSDKAYG